MDNYINELIDICKLPINEINNKFKIIYLGGDILYVSNYIKLLDYGCEKVVLKVKGNTIEILGLSLVIKLLNKKEILISGKIYSVSMGNVYDKQS